MSAKAKKASAELPDAKYIPVDQLLLDPENPRLAELGLSPGESQERILEVMYQQMAIDELVFSIAANGYFRHEPLYAARKGDKYVVVEGNRRLAAVKVLVYPKLRQELRAEQLPTASVARRKELATLPVVVSTRDQIWAYLGFKHVNGPQPWGSYAKAHYIAKVHNRLKIPLEQIARTIGDQHATVKRLYRGLMALEQAEHAGLFNRDDRWNTRFAFSHLYTGLDYAGFQSFLGIEPDKSFQKTPVPKRNLKQLGELLEWLYGSKPKKKKPVVQTQNPDLKLLEAVLKSKNGVAALRDNVPLQIAVDISRGDVELFREALVQAKLHLESARGKVLHGYKGESDLLETAEETTGLANRLLKDMKEIQADRPGRRRREWPYAAKDLPRPSARRPESLPISLSFSR